MAPAVQWVLTANLLACRVTESACPDGIDRSHRVKHGALLDAELLSQLYVEMTGGRQIGLTLADEQAPAELTPQATAPVKRTFIEPRPHGPSEEELARHAAFVATLTNPLWLQES